MLRHLNSSFVVTYRDLKRPLSKHMMMRIALYSCCLVLLLGIVSCASKKKVSGDLPGATADMSPEMTAMVKKVMATQLNYTWFEASGQGKIDWDGQRLSAKALQAQLRTYGKALNIEDVTPHAIRRAVATHLLENGANIAEIKQLLGHGDISSTQVYAQVMPVEMLREHRRYHPRARRKR